SEPRDWRSIPLSRTAATSSAFGPIHRAIGLLEHVACQRAGIAHRPADAGFDREPAAVDLEGRRKHRADAPREPRDLRRVDLLDEHDELIAAEASDEIARSYGRDEPLGHLLQHGIAGQVSVGIVDL